MDISGHKAWELEINRYLYVYIGNRQECNLIASQNIRTNYNKSIKDKRKQSITCRICENNETNNNIRIYKIWTHFADLFRLPI